jgi:hypothetical protein
MVNNVIAVVNYVIAAHPSLLNFMIADSSASIAKASPSSEDMRDRPPGARRLGCCVMDTREPDRTL